MTASRNQLLHNRNLHNNYLQTCCYQSHLGKLYYLDSCQQNTETIVFLHGFTGSSHDFLTLPDASSRTLSSERNHIDLIKSGLGI